MVGPAEKALADLRDRLQQQSRMPALPAGWHSHSAMIPADGFEYGGDFFVADLVDDVLQLVLVDVCGHGDSAVPAAVQF
ncbi:MAG TPA: serine/threonine-protein phosphatase, partial [Nocardioides sp.]|nr:serine/threonine-protein phosphatase [Nocardioides sp.]